LDANRDNQNASEPPEDARQRMVAELTALAGGLAHELRNPLSTMMINLQLLAEDLEDRRTDPETMRRRALLKVHTLRREAERLQSLFDKFLGLTGAYHLQRTETDINAVVAALAKFIEPQTRRNGIDIRLALTRDPLVFSADPNLLRQALLNIVINAQQAMPSGGVLTIATAWQGDDAVIAISDTGVGIAAEDCERVFQPFFSTKAEGNGLGLSITRRIIREHGGSLSFESEPGAGTTFTIRLPRRPSRGAEPETAG
jgi:signal transduction histidine kinase